MAKQGRGWVAIAAVLVVAIAAASVAYRPAPDQNSPNYTADTVRRGDISRVVSTSGALSPWSSVEVSSQISGQVIEVAVDFNAPVKQGQVIARIDPSTYEQRLRQARADLEAAEADYKLAQVDERRMKGLLVDDLVTQQEYDRVAALLQQSEATLTTRKAAVENARVDLERCTIKSPIDGIVIYKQIEVGKTVVSSFSAPTLFAIAAGLSRMRIIATILEPDVALVKPGQTVKFKVEALGEREFRGTLIQIRPPYTPSEKQQQQLQSQQSQIPTFDAVVEVQNPDGALRPGLTAEISVLIEEKTGVLIIPNGALRVDVGADTSAGLDDDSDDEETVYRYPNGKRNEAPQPVRVRVGASDDTNTEVLSGLKEGDLIVTGIATLQEVQGPRRLF